MTVSDPPNILDEAKEVCDQRRTEDYGHPKPCFVRVAAMWSAILSTPVSASEVALCMIALKSIRHTHKQKRDNPLDIAGYARCLELIENE